MASVRVKNKETIDSSHVHFNVTCQYFPPQIDPKELRSNGLYVDDKTVTAIDALGLKNLGYYSVAKLAQDNINSACDIIKTDKDIFAVGKQIGVGAFGKAFILQNLRNKTYFLLKTQEHEYYAAEEHKNLTALGRTDQPLLRIPGTSKDNFGIIMIYEKGEQLYKIIENRFHAKQPESAWPDLLLLKTANEIIHCVKKNMLDRGYFHCDLKPENILDDLVYGVAIIDLAFAKKWKNDALGMPYATGDFEGTNIYISPDMRKQKKSSPVITYSYKTEIFALGNLLTELLFRKLAVWKNDKVIFYDAKIKSKLEACAALKSFLDRMKSDGPSTPSFNETIEFFNRFCKKYATDHPKEVIAVEKILAQARDNEKKRLAELNKRFASFEQKSDEPVKITTQSTAQVFTKMNIAPAEMNHQQPVAIAQTLTPFVPVPKPKTHEPKPEYCKSSFCIVM